MSSNYLILYKYALYKLVSWLYKDFIYINKEITDSS